MTDAIHLSLPWPPSNNTYYRRFGTAVLLSKPGRMYAMGVGVLLARLGIVRNHGTQVGRLHVAITLHEPNRVRRDLDNFCKAVLDALTKARVWEDDALIDRLEIARGDIDGNGRVDVTIRAMAKQGAAS